jgi:PAS domain S-box-containing protein
MKTAQQKALKDRVDRLKREKQRLTGKLVVLRKEKQILQKELRDTQRLLNETPGAVVLTQDKKVIFANKGLQDLLGYPEEEILGRDFLDFVHPDYVEYSLNLRQRLGSGKPVPDQLENFFVTKDGRPLCCEVRWKKIRYQGKTAFFSDIMGLDRREKEEKQLRQSQKINAIARMAKGLNRDIDRGVRILNEHFSYFQGVGSIADKKAIRSLRRIEAEIETADLISQHLDCLTRLKNNKSEIVLFDPKKIIQDAVSITLPKWLEDPKGDAGINVKTYLRTLSPIEGHPLETRDAFVSMLLNAIDALPEGGEIYLTAEENSGFAWIYIQDNGMGIHNNIKDQIFDPFFTTKDDQHAGLGLSLAYAIIKRQGGEIEVMSREGQGATFIVKLPLAQSPVSPKARRLKNRIKGSRILIIAEGGIVADLMTQLFVSKGGKVIASSASMQGLKLLRKKKFDLVVADLDAPYLKSSGIIPKIKKMDKALPIALVNAGKKRSSRTLKGLGADLVIERPLDMDRISSLVSQAIAMKEAPE